MNRLLVVWNNLRSSLWFVPSFLVLGAVVLALLLIEAESQVAREQLAIRWPRLFGAGAEGARGMLSAIASSIITVAGVAFSITIVSFALASSQYTSRILRTFMRDRGNQAVLGVLLGVFVYCLVVLRTIRSGPDGVFVPSLAVLAAVLLALVAVGCLVFFLHHVADSIQASSIVPRVANEAVRSIDRLYSEERPRPVQQPVDAVRSHDLPGQTWIPVPARTTGYVQAIEDQSLLALACQEDTVLRMERGIGEFVIEGMPLVTLAGKQLDEDLIRRVNSAYTTGRHRTVQQDVAFGIRQIVDIALKALSPGINDTTTAIICIDHLGAVLVRLAPRSVESPGLIQDGRLRVIGRGTTFQALVAEALDQIRQNAEHNPAVLARVLDTLAVVAGRTEDPERLRVLEHQAQAVAEAAERNIPSIHDRSIVQAALEHCSVALGGGSRSQA